MADSHSDDADNFQSADEADTPSPRPTASDMPPTQTTEQTSDQSPSQESPVLDQAAQQLEAVKLEDEVKSESPSDSKPAEEIGNAEAKAPSPETEQAPEPSIVPETKSAESAPPVPAEAESVSTPPTEATTPASEPAPVVQETAAEVSAVETEADTAVKSVPEATTPVAETISVKPQADTTAVTRAVEEPTVKPVVETSLETTGQAIPNSVSESPAVEDETEVVEEDVVPARRERDSDAEDEEEAEEGLDGEEPEEPRDPGDGAEEDEEDADEEDWTDEGEGDEVEQLDRSNPAFVPKKGIFYLHDTRTDPNAEEEPEPEKEEEAAVKPRSERASKWGHDMFREDEQAPKSSDELLATYGFDIRERPDVAPPDSGPRYARGPRSGRRPDWRDPDSYSGGRRGRGGPGQRGGGRGRGPPRGSHHQGGGGGGEEGEPELEWDVETEFPALPGGDVPPPTAALPRHQRLPQEEATKSSSEVRGGRGGRGRGRTRGGNAASGPPPRSGQSSQPRLGGFSDHAAQDCNLFPSSPVKSKSGRVGVVVDGRSESGPPPRGGGGGRGRGRGGRGAESVGGGSREFRRSRDGPNGPPKSQPDRRYGEEGRRHGNSHYDEQPQHRNLGPRLRGSTHQDGEEGETKGGFGNVGGGGGGGGAKRYSALRGGGRSNTGPAPPFQPSMGAAAFRPQGPPPNHAAPHQPHQAQQQTYIHHPSHPHHHQHQESGYPYHPGHHPAQAQPLPLPHPDAHPHHHHYGNGGGPQAAGYVEEGPGMYGGQPPPPPHFPYAPAPVQLPAYPPPPPAPAAPTPHEGGEGLVYYDPHAQHHHHLPRRPRKGIPIVPPSEAGDTKAHSPPPQEPTANAH